ncbi:MAG: hypothetical protein GZ091_14770 [Paludibacter sp.]|nr:hypothetical protein [Paludibacter sp.]
MKKRVFLMSALVLITSITVSLSMSSCATKTPFLTSTVIPAAQGTVQVKKDANKNYVITIELSNLAPSTRLTPPMTAYVVWLVTADNMNKNLGQVNTSTNFMSNKLNAKFETVSGIKPTKIFITAENEASVEYPSYNSLILTTDYLK